MAQRRSTVRAGLCPRGDGDALVWRRPDEDPGQNVRSPWYEENRTRNEVVLEKAAVRSSVLAMNSNGFLGEDRPLQPSVNYRTSVIRSGRLQYSHPPPCSFFAYGCSSCRIGFRRPDSGRTLFRWSVVTNRERYSVWRTARNESGALPYKGKEERDGS
jgi:hypothetical protein